MLEPEIDWRSEDYLGALSVQQGDKIFYRPGYMRVAGIHMIGRFLNSRFGISPFNDDARFVQDLPLDQVVVTQAPHSFDSDVDD